jgi:hypothetical protein
MPTSWEQQLRGPMMEGPPLNMDKENQGIYNTRLRAERVMKKPTVLTPTACNSLQPSRDTNSIQKVPDGTCTQQVSESKHKPIEKIFERILKGDGRMSTRTFLKGKFLGKVSKTLQVLLPF